MNKVYVVMQRYWIEDFYQEDDMYAEKVYRTYDLAKKDLDVFVDKDDYKYVGEVSDDVINYFVYMNDFRLDGFDTDEKLTYERVEGWSHTLLLFIKEIEYIE